MLLDLLQITNFLRLITLRLRNHGTVSTLYKNLLCKYSLAQLNTNMILFF